MRRFTHRSAIRATTAEVSLRPTPSKIISPGPISPLIRPPTVTFARLTRWRTARIEVSWCAAASAKARGRFAAATAKPQIPAVAALSFAAVGAMAPLIFSRLAFGVKKIGDGGTPQYDGLAQDLLQRAP